MYELQNGLLHKIHKGKTLICIPKAFSGKIFKILHDSPVGGHAYFQKVYHHYKEHYYTPGLMKLLKDYLSGCLKCQQFKLPKTGPVGKFTNIQPPIGQWTVNKRIYIDFMGSLTKTPRQNQYICHIMDHCTRFAMALPTKGATAKDAMNVLQRWINFFGPPEEIFSDQGKHFLNELFAEYTKTIQASAVFSPTYTAHPNLVERVNQTLVHSLRNYVNQHHDNWDKFVESCTTGYNQRYQDSLKTSPHEVVFGFKPRIPQFTDTTKTTYKKAKDHFRGLDTIRREARRNLEKAIQISTGQANKRRKDPPILRPGEIILLLRPRQPKKRQTTKFLKHYTKPHVIEQRLSDLMYTAKPLGKPNAKSQKVHISKIKRYLPRKVNCISTFSPYSGKRIDFIPDPRVKEECSTHVIYTTISYMLSELSHHLKEYIDMFKYRVPYALATRCKNLWYMGQLINQTSMSD
jgi:hypothetical protein